MRIFGAVVERFRDLLLRVNFFMFRHMGDYRR